MGMTSPVECFTPCVEAAETALSELWTRTRSTHLDRVAFLERAVAAVLAGRLDEATREEARQTAHRITGTVGTFGFHDASMLARQLEHDFASTANVESSNGHHLATSVVRIRSLLHTERTGQRPSQQAEHATHHVLLIGANAAHAEKTVAEGAVRGLLVTVDATGDAVDEWRDADALHGHGFDAIIVVRVASVGEYPCAPAEHKARARRLSRRVSNGDFGPNCALLFVESSNYGVGLSVRRWSSQLGADEMLPANASASMLVDAADAAIDRRRLFGRNILLVDDDPETHALIRAALAPFEHSIFTCETIAGAWQLLGDVEPDLIILDLELGGENGLEFCRLLLADTHWRHVPIVVLSATDAATCASDVFKNGADDFLGKPVSSEELAVRVNNRLRRAIQHVAPVVTDRLAELPGRAQGERQLERAIRRADQASRPLATMLVRLDHARIVYDSAGIHRRDDVLAHCARVIVDAVRPSDIVARCHGSTFLIAMSDCAGEEARDRLGALVAAIEAGVALSAQVDGHERPATAARIVASVTGGLAMFPQDGSTASSVIAAAERALAAGGSRGVRPDDSNGPTFDAPAQMEADIAVVDDDASLAALLMQAASIHGYQVRHFQDGQEAVDRLCGSAPTHAVRVVLLDLNLPGVDGFTVLRRLSADGVLARTRVIVVSARTSERDVLTAFALGAFDVIAKPLSLAVLMQRVIRALNS